MNHQRQNQLNASRTFQGQRRHDGPGLRRAPESGVFLVADSPSRTQQQDQAPITPSRDARWYLRWRVSDSSIPTLIFVRRTGAIVAANEAAARAYGFTREELLARSISDLVPPTGSLADRLLALHHPETRWTAPLVQRRKDGSTFLAEVGMLEAGVAESATMVIVVDVREGTSTSLTACEARGEAS